MFSLLVCLQGSVYAGNWPGEKAFRDWANNTKGTLIEKGIYEVIWIDSPGEGTIVVTVTQDIEKNFCAAIAELVGRSFRNTFQYYKFLGVHVWEKDAWWETCAKHWTEK